MKPMKIVKICLFTLIALLVLGGLVMLLWNWLLPDLIGASEISLLQALGLLLLCKLLFGSSERNNHRTGKYWRKRLKRRMEKMSDEERAAFLNTLQSINGKVSS